MSESPGMPPTSFADLSAQIAAHKAALDALLIDIAHATTKLAWLALDLERMRDAMKQEALHGPPV